MIGQKIQKLRELKNFTQEYMAEQLKMSQANYSRLENDNIGLSVDKLQIIAQILEVSPSDLMAFDEKMVFNISNNNFKNGLKELNVHSPSISSQERALYEQQIQSLKSENEHLRNLIDKILEGKQS
jgi:transcriptional regulator with XRE-family HTH domain